MRTSTYNAWDRALDGTLTKLLLDWDAEGLPPEEIGYRLRSEYDVKVSRSTVSRWLIIAKTDAEKAS